MNLFTELKRRNVFRVTIAYVISAWLLAQVADLVLENIGAPPWVIQTILLILALVFPIVVFFAWAYEVTPEGVKRQVEIDQGQSITHLTGKKLDRVIMAMLVLALGYFIWESRFASGREEVVSEQVAETVVSQQDEAPLVEELMSNSPSRLSIAVLPFDNRSNREEDQFFTDGIHDDLLTTIAKIGSMKVISRTSVMEYKGTTKKIPEIANELGVANVLEGGIQRSGNQVRINVQLIDANSDEHLWAETFDRELTAENLFAIQSEISERIAAALQATLTPAEKQRIDTMPTDSLDAYEAYLRGKQLLATRRVADIERATTEFQRAANLDPEFALAWVGIADSHDLLTNYRRDPVMTGMEIRQEAVAKALELDPELGEAWVSQAQIYIDLDRLEEAEAAFKKGLELSPNYAQGFHWYSALYSEDELRTRENLELAYRARELDPRSLVLGANLAGALFQHGLYDRAVDEVQRLIDLDPEFPNSYHLLLDHHLRRTGELAKALENARQMTQMDPDHLDGYRHQGEVFAVIGDYESARAMQEKMIDINPDHFFVGWIDFLIAIFSDNSAALDESINWLLSRTQDLPYMAGFMGEAKLWDGDFDGALELFLSAKPDWLNPDGWESAIRYSPSDACEVAWLFLHTGRETLGHQLLAQALEMHNLRLPAAQQHADRHSPEICYLANGENQRALDSLQTQLDHGHNLLWEPEMRSPVYDPVRDDPRFISMQEQHEQKIAVQRELIEAMDHSN